MLTGFEILKLFKFWVELGIRYVRGQCTPQEELAVGIVLAAIALLLAAVAFGSVQLLLERLYIPPHLKKHWLLGKLATRFSASRYYKWVDHT